MVNIIKRKRDKKLKAKLPAGVWQKEPDYQYWKDSETKLDCLIVRNQLGSLCGYVGVPKDHLFYKKSYIDCTLPSARKRTPEEIIEDTSWIKEIRPLSPMTSYIIEKSSKQLICDTPYCEHKLQSMLNAHGGITYTNMCQGDVCHPVDNDDEHVWWIGFDCAHLNDICPVYIKNLNNFELLSQVSNSTYKNIRYVENQITNLAKEISRYKKPEETLVDSEDVLADIKSIEEYDERNNL